MWTNKQLFIAILMVVTGSLNTLSTKWADTMNSPGRDGESRKFNHPYLQACSMFVGEIMCLVAFNIVYLYRKWKRRSELEEVIPLVELEGASFNRLIFLPPAMMDLLATSTMYVGLNLTFASSFQMLRGAVIVFTGLLSVAFLNRNLTFVKWFGITFIILGLGIVGLSDFSTTGSSAFGRNNMITGDLLIVMAQIISATQMVYEEKFVSKYNVPPLQAVGWEGVFGFLVLGFLLFPMYFIHVPKPFSDNPRGVLEDAIDGFIQLYNNPLLVCAFLGTVISIAFFNFAGVSVTKELSATTRMVLDSVRTVVIWIVSLGVKWQQFNYLQVIGFLLLISGMCLYNNVIIVPTLQRWGLVRRPLLNEPPRAVFANPTIVTSPESNASSPAIES